MESLKYDWIEFMINKCGIMASEISKIWRKNWHDGRNFDVGAAEAMLTQLLGAPAKPATKYVIGFSKHGRLLALRRQILQVRFWFEPPAPPPMPGIELLDVPANRNSNLNGPLARLSEPDIMRCTVLNSQALCDFLSWYLR